MPYGNYPPNYGGGYSANPVSTGGQPSYGGYSPSAFPDRGGAMVDDNPAVSAQDAGGGGGGGMGAAGWMGIFQMVGDKLEGRRAARAAADAAGNDIPEDPAYMRPFLDEMAVEGRQLKDSKLGARPMMEANAAGHDAAVSRGLSGPLAAAVQAESVNNAQGAYDKWRQGALMQHRQLYMDRVQQYMKAIQKYKAAKTRAAYAHREATLANIPVGPIGHSLYEMGLDNAGTSSALPLGTGSADTLHGIQQAGDYRYTPPSSY